MFSHKLLKDEVKISLEKNKTALKKDWDSLMSQHGASEISDELFNGKGNAKKLTSEAMALSSAVINHLQDEKVELKIELGKVRASIPTIESSNKKGWFKFRMGIALGGLLFVPPTVGIMMLLNKPNSVHVEQVSVSNITEMIKKLSASSDIAVKKEILGKISQLSKGAVTREDLEKIQKEISDYVEQNLIANARKLKDQGRKNEAIEKLNEAISIYKMLRELFKNHGNGIAAESIEQLDSRIFDFQDMIKSLKAPEKRIPEKNKTNDAKRMRFENF